MHDHVLHYIRDRELIRAGDRVSVAVSGGADSVALLRVLLELRSALGIVLSVAHFNHHLRGEASDADQAFVAELALDCGLEFFAGHGDVRAHSGQHRLTLEASARQLRYQWFWRLACEQNLDEIATGHTLDDQAETVLMRLLRGAGTRGLAGIYPDRKLEASPSAGFRARVVRPQLNVTRAEVEAYLAALNQPWREDDSNRDPRFLRNRMRHELLPLLEREYNPNLRQVLSEAAEIARGEEEYWSAVVEPELRARTAAPLTLDVTGFPELSLPLRRRLLKRFIENEGLAADFEHIENILRCAIGHMARTELPGGWTATREGDRIRLLQVSNELRRATTCDYRHTLLVPGEIAIPEIGRTLRAVLVAADGAEQAEPGTLLDADLLPRDLTVRNWCPGDRYRPACSGSEEKLKRLFAERKIPEFHRAAWPIVTTGNDIVWTRGFPVAHQYQWRGKGNALRIEEVT